jgi:predicted O-methyltransferase YrrM
MNAKTSLPARVKTRIAHAGLRMFVHPPADRFGVPGYLHPLEGRFLHWLAGRVPAGGTALEVGSFKGKSAGFIASGLRPGARLVCVDTWNNDAMPYDQREDVKGIFDANTRPYADRVSTLRGSSVEVAKTFRGSLDLLFIDGDHSYEGARDDIVSWLPFVRPGGWVALHDAREPPVVQATREFFPPSARRGDVWVWSIFAAQKKG